MNRVMRNIARVAVGILLAAAVVTGTAATSRIEAEAAARTVSITSALIQGGQVVVSVSATSVPATDDGRFYLYADEVYQDGAEGVIVDTEAAGRSVTFTFPLNLGQPGDRLSQKFVVCGRQRGSMVQLSDEHYITNPEGVAESGTIRNDHGIKGILPDPARLMGGEIQDLGVQQASYNIDVSDIIGETSDASVPTIYYTYDGVTYAFNGYRVANYDGVIKYLSVDCGLQVSINILNGRGSKGTDLIHPLANDGHDAPNYAFNTETAAGTAHLKAIASFLGQRYNGQHDKGQVDNWIVGNEVNARTEQYYTSSADLDTNVNIYQKAFRIFYNGIKSMNPSANIYNSIDQEWNRKSNPGSFLSKEYLDRFNYYINREGNIDWGLSFHPYNSPLYDPYTWLGYDVWVHKDIKTPYITMQNLYILTDYMHEAQFLSPSGQVRSIALSEIGFTSSYGESLQAASVVYGYLQAAANADIDSFMLFRMTDEPSEMKSNIAQGLLNTNGTHKMAYDYYKYIDTANAATYINGASRIIGEDVMGLIGNRNFKVRGGWVDPVAN